MLGVSERGLGFREGWRRVLGLRVDEGFSGLRVVKV